MNQVCELCGNAGTLRDGEPCPLCSMSRWRQLGSEQEVVRPKRLAWVRPAPYRMLTSRQDLRPRKPKAS